MKFAVTVVFPPGYSHSAAFHEVAETLHYGLQMLGHDSVLTCEGKLPGRQHIVLGANLLQCYPLPLADNAILYNLEQVEPNGVWFQPKLLEIFRRYTVWDYSQQNAARLATLGVRVAQVVPIGYVRELTRITRAAPPDIDVLFCGSLNPRRKEILQQMNQAGLQVTAAFGVYGQARDALIGRAKLLLNVHYYDAKVLEQVRIAYLLANRCTVLSEPSADPDEDLQFAGGVAFADYAQLVQRACALLDAPAECRQLAQQGYAIMAGRPITHYLQTTLASYPVGLDGVTVA